MTQKIRWRGVVAIAALLTLAMSTFASVSAPVTHAAANTVEDNFARPDQTGWGTSTNTDGALNYAWGGDANGSNSAVAISGGVGEVVDAQAYNTIAPSGKIYSVGDALMRFSYPATGAIQAGPMLANSNTNFDWYWLNISSVYNTFQVQRDYNGTKTKLGTAVSFTPTPGTSYWARLDLASGGVLSARVWQDGTTEPTTWQYQTTDSSPLPSGVPGVHTYCSGCGTTDEFDTTYYAFSSIGLATGPASTPPPPAPTVSGFSPSSGNPGASIALTGAAFTGATSVTFNGTSATYDVLDDNDISAAVPTGATNGPICVVTPAGQGCSSGSFTVTTPPPPPAVTSFSPTSGNVGASVSLTGTGFTGASSVTFNGTPASSPTVASDTSITATVPSGATSGVICVTTPNGQGCSSSSFTVTTPPPPAPAITSFSPTSGPAGTGVTLTGTNFTGVSAVNFNGTSAAFTFVSDTSVTATVPSGATSGNISLTTPSGTGTSASAFTVTSSGSAPAVTDFTPLQNNVGNPVMIEGSNFTGATAVTFNGINATTFQVSRDGAISARVPSGATNGPICVTNPSGRSCSALSFTVGGIPTSVPTGHDNSTAAWHEYRWTHGDPNEGNAAGNGQTNAGYYYLKAYVSGPVVFCEVYSAGDWLIQLEDANKNVFMQLQTNGTGGRVYMTNAITGNLYQCRISDNGSHAQKDYAELNSGAVGDTHTSDCGGPGPVWDPNFNEPPMEPAHTSGMPINGCDHPSAVSYVSTDPRVSDPVQEQHDLGANNGSHTYTITTTRAGDLTAFAFIGNQGTNGTFTIRNSSGTIINGIKWGDMTPNPKTMNQSFSDADAGVQPAGTYQIQYTGPSNPTQDIWALVGNT